MPFMLFFCLFYHRTIIREYERCYGRYPTEVVKQTVSSRTLLPILVLSLVMPL